MESVAAYEEAIPALLAAGDERAAGLAMVHFGRVLWRYGDTLRAREVSANAVTLLEDSRDSSLVLAYGRVAALDALGGRSEQAIEWANKGIELADEIGFDNIIAPSRDARASPESISATRVGSTTCVQRSILLWSWVFRPRTPQSTTATSVRWRVLENLARGRELLEAGLEFARSRGHTHHVMVSRAYLLTHLFHEGRWDELLEEADTVIEWDRERGATQIEAWTVTDAAMVLVHRGQTSKATSLVSATLPRARGIADPQTVLPVLATAALVALARDDLGSADTLLAEYEAGRAPGHIDDELPVWLTTVALGLGDLVRAETLLSGYKPWTTCGRNALAHSRALIAEAAGRRDEAAGLFTEVADGWEAWGSTPLRAYALLGLGDCSGDTAALVESHAIFATLGATPITNPAASPRQQQV